MVNQMNFRISHPGSIMLTSYDATMIERMKLQHAFCTVTSVANSETILIKNI